MPIDEGVPQTEESVIETKEPSTKEKPAKQKKKNKGDDIFDEKDEVEETPSDEDSLAALRL
ncbi:MAG: hypothetical protein JKY11_07975, partial [Alphaproteobacteria bacterium]|nr:hypothetical protein [Alphaproteobacteria bacterium]